MELSLKVSVSNVLRSLLAVQTITQAFQILMGQAAFSRFSILSAQKLSNCSNNDAF